MMKSINGRLQIVFVVIMLFVASKASAQPNSDYSASFQGIIDALRIVGGAIFTLAMIYGSAKMIAAGGDPKMLEEGKNIVKNAVIGLLIILAASAIPSLTPPKIEPIYFDFP
ncbi:hypothetical protein DRP05_02800 [Archaeoglobales archaeon]|nr:MAG: hypothetical protein DRP05_02800 [Archaeoglobales archaeon]